MSTWVTNQRILLVDDNRSIHEDFRKVLAGEGGGAAGALDAAEEALFGAPSIGGGASAPAATEKYELDSVYQGADAVARVEAAVAAGHPYAMAFVDVRMPPGIDGVETAERLLRIDPQVQVVICTAFSDHPWEEVSRRLGCSDRVLILRKPFDPVEVRQLARSLTTKWAMAVQTASQHLRALTAEVESRRRAEQELESFFTLAPELLCITSLEGAFSRVNPAWSRLLGYTPEELAGRRYREFFHPDDAAEVDRLAAALAMGQSIFGHEGRVRTRDGDYRWLSWTVVPNTSQGVAYAVAHDVTERKRAEAALLETQAVLHRDARHDRLTGLPNRAALHEHLGPLAARARGGGALFGVLFLDFDRFKLINDSLGHQVGDRFLQEVADRLRERLAAAPGAADDRPIAARLGGDEFVVLVKQTKGAEELAHLAEELQAVFKRPFRHEQQELIVSASIGIAVADASCAGADAILRDADTAMYHAKLSGRARHAVFDPAMHGRIKQRLDLENDLRKAIERDELHLVFQPLVSLEHGRVEALETLLRWRHPTRGMVSPAEFIPVCEESGLIVGIGRWALQQACRQLVELRRQQPDLIVSVNLSRRQLVEPSLADDVAAALRAAGVPAGALKLEITESAVMEDQEQATAALLRLKALGVGLWLDDFGTGYSSLSCLHTFPIDGLKIDRSFIGNMSGRRGYAAVIHAIVAVAQNLDLAVVAEGVETQEQLAQLQAFDCQLAQGFLFAAPMAADAVGRWIAERDRAARGAAA